MKKIGILTFHRALNYGAVLQAYALTKTIEGATSSEVTPEIIDYRCSQIEKTRNVLNRMKKPSSKQLAGCMVTLYKVWNYNRFLSQRMRVSKKIYTSGDVALTNKQYDCFIVGSDQVWNYKLNGDDKTYLLDFVEDNKKKASYAASMGLVKLDSPQLLEYKKNLSTFHHISVREQQCAQYLSQAMGLEKVRTTVDPALLLKAEQWSELAGVKKRRNPYILVYNVPRPDFLFEMAQQLEKQTGIKAIYITNSQRPKARINQLVYPGIEEFVSLFQNAAYVITNSFHGTVFSILFHRQFLVERKMDSTANDRIDTLLSLCNLTDRASSCAEVNKIFCSVDWKNVDSMLERERSIAMDYLKEICNQIRREE